MIIKRVQSRLQRYILGDDPVNSKYSFRKNRLKLCFNILQITSNDSILDVGGNIYYWVGTGFEKNVTILNMQLPETLHNPFKWVQGDACAMSDFEVGSYDIVFSNSVIEHVGDFEKQKRMSQEVRRVGKKYWIQTPYRHFPIEMHFLIPFFQYLPKSKRKYIAKLYPFSFSKVFNLDTDYDLNHIWLLNKKNLKSLFPDSHIIEEKLFGFTKSLIA